MKTDFILAVILIAVGTYLIRSSVCIQFKKGNRKAKPASNQSVF